MNPSPAGKKLLRQRGDMWDAVEYAPNGRTFSQVSTPVAAQLQQQGYVIVPDAEFEAAQAQHAAAQQAVAPHGPYQVPDEQLSAPQSPGPAESVALERALRGQTQAMTPGMEGLVDAWAPAVAPQKKQPAPMADHHGALIRALRGGRR
jgi:hypothetical protein